VVLVVVLVASVVLIWSRVVVPIVLAQVENATSLLPTPIVGIFSPGVSVRTHTLLSGNKLDREKLRLEKELEAARVSSEQALAQMEASLAKETRLRKVLRLLDTREKEMFSRELLSIEEVERLQGAPGSTSEVPSSPPVGPEVDWSLLSVDVLTDLGFVGEIAQSS
jgi:hypothetical protein